MSLTRKAAPQSPAVEIRARLEAELAAAHETVAGLPSLGLIQLAVAQGEPGASARLMAYRSDKRDAVEALENVVGALAALDQAERDEVAAGVTATHAGYVLTTRHELDAKTDSAKIIAEHVSIAMAEYRKLLAHNAAAYKAFLLAGGRAAPGKLFDSRELSDLLGGLFYRNSGVEMGWPGSRRTHMKNTSAVDAEPPMAETLAKAADWIVGLLQNTAPPAVLAPVVAPADLAEPVSDEPAVIEAAQALTAEQALAVQPKARRLPGTGGGDEGRARK